MIVSPAGLIRREKNYVPGIMFFTMWVYILMKLFYLLLVQKGHFSELVI
jgi:hypothetical protein